MTQQFFDAPILNSPYASPVRHWELDTNGQPTNIISPSRRSSSLVSPIPKAKKSRNAKGQQADFLADRDDLGFEQEYNPTEVINGIRSAVASWRDLTESQWNVTPTTARLLRHWRTHEFTDQKPFFCQIEAVETVIWLTEVAPKSSSQGRRFWAHLEEANLASNPELLRLALKLATGAGKTTVMAMLIAWQTVNAVRHPDSKRFSKGFLVVAPGITIKDRLRVLQPNDPDSYYRSRELVPEDMLGDLGRAKIVITNYHAFKRKDEIALNKVQQAALKTDSRPESDGSLIRRVAGELMGMKNIVVLNDEAHHCYRERPLTDEERRALKGDELDEAKEANEAARLWISGLEALNRVLGIQMVYDLSATPFFLKGSGYREGSLFGWVMSDFSLLDAIESGIVKLPRVPIIDNVPGGDTPKFRNLWEHVGKSLPKKGRANAKDLNPQQLHEVLLAAIDALYGHYEETRELWRQAGIGVDPVFIVVCNNTSTSKLVHDYIAGYTIENANGSTELVAGRCKAFRNFDPDGVALPVMRTLLIDSGQLESGEAISKEFREAAAGEIERFRQEMIQRSGDQRAGEKITDEEILREVMNTVGKPGRLGEGIRCVVSVSMLTEGWDANTVTHVLGVRAFGTQLLCEQVIGRALRRQSYVQQPDGLFKVEYADILGIPFDFTAAPVQAKPAKPDNTVHVHAVSPDRDALEIQFPRVEGYRTDLPQERLEAKFTANSTLELTPDLVGPSETRNQGLIGEGVDLTLKHLADMRASSVLFELTERILKRYYADDGGQPKRHLFMPLKSIVRRWMDEHLKCADGNFPAQVLYHDISQIAAQRIIDAITLGNSDTGAVKAILDAYNRTGSTRHVGFNTSKARYQTDPNKCHINYCVLDSDWEAEFCRVAEKHPKVLAYVKNHNLGFEVPYRMGAQVRRYRPDFIVKVDDGKPDPLNLIVETKGYRGEDAKDKATTMDTYWVPGVNNIGTHGRWAFAEFTNVWTIQSEFETLVQAWLDKTIQGKSA
ncbi:BPTD_3080 family restriction endonuclease [Polymorphobacter fuscus]|uniref:Restriction endonuclease n=1 Tax=Sandarakinorhabdus fusca TaxID=1439888 RepID=A0A7C9GP61_9SPHN|nr:DEAD/DEAH box helicase family protein [Polymorphobacter fuscus]KAB7646100.1 restriction endonuclease [Polymorphobacter fuscus]MQT17297.1 restriction endonuclease [Polymorphobacter fuscus]NJC10170.1 type III restriction enzyme [Polymorphobacter fuscus]